MTLSKTIRCLTRELTLHRASSAREYLSGFHRDAELSQSFYALVSTYSDEKYLEVKKLFGEIHLDGSLIKPRKDQQDIFKNEHDERLANLNVGRDMGSRFYHPAYFQGTPEERNLDRLLDYYNIIGFNLESGLVDYAMIDAVLGDYLRKISRRKAVSEYIDLCNDANWNPDQVALTYVKRLTERFQSR